MATITGTAGNDTITSFGVSPGVTGGVPGIGFDLIRGSGGSDIIEGYGSLNQLDYSAFGPANFIVLAFDNTSSGTVLKTGLGKDTFYSINSFRGTTGGDLLTGFAGQSGLAIQLAGLAGNDTINGAALTPNNLADYIDSPTGVSVDLGTGTAKDGWGGTDTLISVHFVRGSNFADTLTGGDGTDWFAPTIGADVINGNGGENWISYGYFSDLGPVSVVFGATAFSGTTSKNGSGAGTDTFTSITGIIGSSSNDTIIGSTDPSLNLPYSIKMRGGDGSDLLDGQKSQLNVADYSYVTSGSIVANLQTSLDSSGNWLGTVSSSTFMGAVDTLRNVVRVEGTRFGDRVTGSAANDRLDLFGGDDTLDGGMGADTLVGGTGNDLYVVDNSGDVVADTPSGGNDTVRSTVDWTLGADIETLILDGTAKFGTGNALANAIIGNASRNNLSGLDGNDSLSGGDGRDQLDGGAGADTLDGGAGGDTYVVDDAGDVLVEAPSGGIDLVKAAISWTLGTELDDLLLLDGVANGTGNDLGNSIEGNTAANVLTGAGGSDSLTGGGGNDTLLGGTGRDRLTGGGGRDRMNGGAQGDVFVWADPSEGRDTIAGFNGSQDDLEFSAAGFGGGLLVGVALSATQFEANTTGFASAAAVRFVFNTTTGVLNYDRDGSGAAAAQTIATFTGGAAVTAADILVVA